MSYQYCRYCSAIVIPGAADDSWVLDRPPVSVDPTYCFPAPDGLHELRIPDPVVTELELRRNQMRYKARQEEYDIGQMRRYDGPTPPGLHDAQVRHAALLAAIDQLNQQIRKLDQVKGIAN